jgi:hypothetical protein
MIPCAKCGCVVHAGEQLWNPQFGWVCHTHAPQLVFIAEPSVLVTMIDPEALACLN